MTPPEGLRLSFVERGTSELIWPSDPDHREAVETLLLMAEGEHRSGQARQATRLLHGAERIVGRLPERYARLRTQIAERELDRV